MGTARGKEIRGVPAWQQLARMQSVNAFQQHTRVALATFTKQKQRLFPTMPVIPGGKRKRTEEDATSAGVTSNGSIEMSLKETLEKCGRMCLHLKCSTKCVHLVCVIEHAFYEILRPLHPIDYSWHTSALPCRPPPLKGSEEQLDSHEQLDSSRLLWVLCPDTFMVVLTLARKGSAEVGVYCLPMKLV